MVDSAVRTRTTATISKYEHPARVWEVELPGYGGKNFDNTDPEWAVIPVSTRDCVIGPKGMTTTLDKNMWYLCAAVKINPTTNLFQPVQIPVQAILNALTLNVENQNEYWQRRCNYKTCPCLYQKNSFVSESN